MSSVLGHVRWGRGRQIGRQKTGCATPGPRLPGCRQAIDKSGLADFASSARADVLCERTVLPNRRPPDVGPDCRAGWAGQDSVGLGHRVAIFHVAEPQRYGMSAQLVRWQRGAGRPTDGQAVAEQLAARPFGAQLGARSFAVQCEVRPIGEPLGGRICAAQERREVQVQRAPLVPLVGCQAEPSPSLLQSRQREQTISRCERSIST